MLDKTQESDESGAVLVRSVIVGCTIGLVSVLALVTPIVAALGADWGAALGVGAFIAVWGGLGFGAMVAGVLRTHRFEVDEAAAKAQRAAARRDGERSVSAAGSAAAPA
jgi:Na+/melibiose symporter-like transporter